MIRFIAIMVCALLVSSCSGLGTFPDEVEELTDAAIDALIARDRDWLDQNLPEEVTADPTYDDVIAWMFVNLPDGAETSRRKVTWSVKAYAGTNGMNTTYTSQYVSEFEDDDRVRFEVAVVRSGGELALQRLYYVLEVPPRMAGFGLLAQSPLRLAFGIALLASVLFTFGTAGMVVMRWQDLRNPARWLVVGLLGGGALVMDWQAGTVAFEMLAFGLFGGGFEFAPGGGPLLSLHLPIGAALFWILAKEKFRAGAWPVG